MRRRPLRFGLALGAALLAGAITFGTGEGVLLVRRSFFGIHSLIQSPRAPFNELYHGTTLHGRQFINPVTQQPTKPQEPLTYYHGSGPVGQIMQMLDGRAKEDRPLSVAAVGLGTGSVAAYAQPGSEWSFFEIDPTVLWLARDAGYFSYLSAAQARGANMQFILGDARLTIGRAPDQSFDLIVLDAFSSDSIPVHLLTRQALAVYRKKLRAGGWIAVHASNQYLDLRPVVANLATDAGLTCAACFDAEPPNIAPFPGKERSIWLLLVPDVNDLAPLAGDRRWTLLARQPSYGVWSDDFSNVVTLLRWNQ